MRRDATRSPASPLFHTNIERCVGISQATEDGLLHRRTHKNTSLAHFLHRAQQTIRRISLHHIAVRTGAQHTLRKKRFLSLREHQNGKMRKAPPDFTQCSKRIPLKRKGVKNHQIGPPHAQHAQRSLNTIHLRAHAQLRIHLQEAPDRTPHKGARVHQYYSARLLHADSVKVVIGRAPQISGLTPNPT